MNIPGKTPRQYPFRGGQITAKQAADHFNISIKTFYNRLAKCGDNMEAAYAYYENRFGGGNDDMKKISCEDHERMDRQRAEDEILGILCGSGASVKQIDPETGTAKLMDAEDMIIPCAMPKPKLPAETIFCDCACDINPQGTEMSYHDAEPDLPAAEFHPDKICTAPAINLDPIQKQINDQQLHSLTLYNTAISALHALAQEGIDDFETSQRADDLLERLKCVRSNTFEHMVPWDAIAKGAFK